ncbi:hypothetical protein, partial [Halocynthiibacter sp.]|uniref:hypothetical protein n=1 Tax=Halocynthiibacter sp. TaxID=1979210 RepID=UPI003C50FDE1
DFEAGTDKIEVNFAWDDTVPTDAPEITIEANAEDTGAHIKVNGVSVAFVTGGQDLEPGDIAVNNATSVGT